MAWLLANMEWIELALLVIAGGVVVWLRGKAAQDAALAELLAALDEAIGKLIAIIAALAKQALEDVTREEVDAAAELFYDRLPLWVQMQIPVTSFQQMVWNAWERLLKEWHVSGPAVMQLMK